MKFILLHGTLGNPEGNWFPWLAHKLEEKGNSVTRPQLPTPAGQNPDNWVKTIQSITNQVGGPDEETVFVAHSMSCLAVCLYLQFIPSPIHACYFVAGFAKHLPNTPDPYPQLNDPFIDTPIDWAKVRENSKKFVCFGSDNDSYVPFETAKNFSDQLSGEFIIVPGAGHFSESSGYTTFPKLLEKIEEKV